MHDMSYRTRFWIDLVSRFGFIGVISGLLAPVVGELVLDMAPGAAPATRQTLLVVGTVFGFSTAMLMLLGMVLAPGELLGWHRGYWPKGMDTAELRMLSRGTLLAAAAVLCWIALASFVLVCMTIRDVHAGIGAI